MVESPWSGSPAICHLAQVRPMPCAGSGPPPPPPPPPLAKRAPPSPGGRWNRRALNSQLSTANFPCLASTSKTVSVLCGCTCLGSGVSPFWRWRNAGRIRRTADSPSGSPGAVRSAEVAIVSDRVIADVHRRFMNIPGPTDVITFDHGEIVVSAGDGGEARRHSSGIPVDAGAGPLHWVQVDSLLHLNGYDDRSESDAIHVFATLCERILQAYLHQLSIV